MVVEGGRATCRIAAASLVACAIAAGGCAAEPLTEIFAAVDSDLAIPTELDAVEIEIRRPPEPPLGPFQTYVDPVQRFHVALPVTLGLQGDERAQEIEVVARALRRTRVVVEQTARLGYRRGEVVLLCLRLDASCVSVTCPGGATCRNGTCELPDLASSSLPTYRPDDPIDCATPSR